MRSVVAVPIADHNEFGRTEIEVLSAGVRLAEDLGGTLTAVLLGEPPASFAPNCFSHWIGTGEQLPKVQCSPHTSRYLLPRSSRSFKLSGATFSSSRTTSGRELRPLSGHKLGASEQRRTLSGSMEESAAESAASSMR